MLHKLAVNLGATHKSMSVGMMARRIISLSVHGLTATENGPVVYQSTCRSSRLKIRNTREISTSNNIATSRSWISSPTPTTDTPRTTSVPIILHEVSTTERSLPVETLSKARENYVKTPILLVQISSHFMKACSATWSHEN